MNGAQVLVSTLQRLGVERVFGIPGIQNLALFDALAGTRIQTVQVTHELSAAFMADAVGRVTGRPGVLVVVPGPGVTNAATGLAEALLDSSPVLAVVTGVRRDLPVRFPLHGMNQAGLLGHVTKKVFQVESPDQVASVVREAYALATAGEPGPVAVEVPANVLTERAKTTRPARLAEAREPVGPGRKIERICELIRQSARPCIYAGVGAMGASADLVDLAERICAPVATTISGRGVIPEDHFLSVGFGYGGSGTELAEKVFEGCDLLLAVGCKLGEVTAGGHGAKVPRTLVHIDSNPKALGAGIEPTVALAADAGAAIREILRGLSDYRRADVCQMIDGLTAHKAGYLDAVQSLPDDTLRVNPRKLMVRLRVHLARNAIVTTDSGNHAFHVLADFPALLPRTVLAPTDFNSMGFSIPAAVACAMARPGRQVVATVGDGGFLMTGNELVTARRHGLRVVAIVFNDGALGLIKLLQKGLFRRTSAVDLPALDLEGFARFADLDYVRIADDLEIDVGIKRALLAQRPVVVDARVRYEEPGRYFKSVLAANAGRMPFSHVLRIGARHLRRSIMPSA